MDVSTKGILYPSRLPSLHRLPAPSSVAHLVRWFWIPEWDLAAGRTSRQHVLAHPATNLVVQVDDVELSGPATRRTYRDLSGRGWAVGALLRPALLPHFTDDPGSLRDREVVVDLPALHATVSEAMRGADREAARQGAVAAYVAWLEGLDLHPSPAALLANALVDACESAPGITRLEDLAEHLSVSPRTVQRLARAYVGLPPSALLRRRRLQDAAERLRNDPDVDVADVAAEWGYADHAHLTHEFRAVLGMTPTEYRERSSQRGTDA